MDFTVLRALKSLFMLINKGIRNIIDYNASHPDFPMEASPHQTQHT